MMSPVAAKPASIESLADNAIDDVHRFEDAVEEIAKEPDVKTVKDLTFAQRRVFALAGFEDERAVNGKINRVKEALEQMKLAGSHGEYSAAKGTLTKASKALEDKAPTLRAEIAILQGQLMELEDAEVQAEHRLAGMQAARDRLRSERLLPEKAWRSHQQLMGYVSESEVAERHRAIETRLQQIDAALKLEVADRGTILHLQAAAPECVLTRRGASITSHTVDPVAFTKYRQQLKDEQARLRKDFETVDAKYREAVAEAQDPRDYWIERL